MIKLEEVMQELPALKFIATVTEIKRLGTILNQEQFGPEVELTDLSVRETMAETMESMRDSLALIGDRSSWAAAERAHTKLSDHSQRIKFGELKELIRDIESRFADHLDSVKLFVLRSDQLPFLGNASDLLNSATAEAFPSSWFDVEEAAKCIVVLRPTAAVFHCMRLIEIAIRVVASALGIDDPVKPAARNWANILRQIKAAIDEKFPIASRSAGSEGAFYESVYATFDAVKNPWRNETMHVEGVYTDAEAMFILNNSIALLQRIGTRLSEKSS